MAWKSPKVIEIAVGMEINCYACAELYALTKSSCRRPPLGRVSGIPRRPCRVPGPGSGVIFPD